MIRRNTWIALLALALLLALSFWLNNQRLLEELEPEAAAPTTEFLFTSEEGLPTRIRVEAGTTEVVELAHNEAGEWTLIQPQQAAADQGLAEAAASQVNVRPSSSNVN